MKEYRITNVNEWHDFKKTIDNYYSYLKSCGLIFEPITIKVSKLREKRTSKQLRLYWVVIGEVKKAFREAGYLYTKNQVHELFKSLNDLHDEEILSNGTRISTPKTLSDEGEAKTKELNEHIEFIVQWTSENLNYYIDV